MIGYNTMLEQASNRTTAVQYPKLAILQLREGPENYLRRFESIDNLRRHMNELPKIENYELIYIEHDPTIADTAKYTQSIYDRFNSDSPRPVTYYGHSLSVSDVVVLATSEARMQAYYVDSFGFQTLFGFLNKDMRGKIRISMDVRREYEACKAFCDTYTRYPNPVEHVVVCTAATRMNALQAYQPIFNLAGHRQQAVATTLPEPRTPGRRHAESER